METLSIEEIQKKLREARGPQPELVKTPELAPFGILEVHVLPCDANDRDWYDQLQSAKRFPLDSKGNFDEKAVDFRGLRSALVARQLCDAKGKRATFTDLEVQHLGTLSGAAIDRIYCRIRDTSGLGEDAVEAAEKNSSSGRSEDS